MTLKLSLSFLMLFFAAPLAHAQTPTSTPAPDASKVKTEKKVPEGIVTVEGEYFINIGAKIGEISAKKPYQKRVREGKALADEKCRSWGYKNSAAFYYKKEKNELILTDAFCVNEPSPRYARIAMMKDRLKRKESLTPQGKNLAKYYQKLTIKGYKTTDLAGESNGMAAGTGGGQNGTDGKK